jgi:SAM-dependent methyltransferase
MGHIISLCQALHARRIVDIGCGNGALCRELADHGYEVVGCEPSAESGFRIVRFIGVARRVSVHGETNAPGFANLRSDRRGSCHEWRRANSRPDPVLR